MTRIAVLGLFALACSDDSLEPRTGLLVVVQSDLAGGSELERVMLKARRHDGRHTVANVTLGEGEGRHALPFSFAVYARPVDFGKKIDLNVAGFGPGELDPIVRRSARLRFREGELVRLVLPLPRECRSRFRACEADGKTCGQEGECMPVEIDVRQLEAVGPGEELVGLIELPPPFPEEGEGSSRLPIRGGEKGAPPRDAGHDGSEPLDNRPPDAGRDATVELLDSGQDARVGFQDGGPDADAQPDAKQGDEPDTGVEAGPISPPSCDDGQTRCEGATLQSCLQGEWEQLACFSGCTDPHPPHSDQDSGASARHAGCDSCAPGERRCGRNRILACGSEGDAVANACHFGCVLSPLAVCQETTPDGVALLNTVIN